MLEQSTDTYIFFSSWKLKLPLIVMVLLLQFSLLHVKACHTLVNTSTITLTVQEICKFVESHNKKKILIKSVSSTDCSALLAYTVLQQILYCEEYNINISCPCNTQPEVFRLNVHPYNSNSTACSKPKKKKEKLYRQKFDKIAKGQLVTLGLEVYVSSECTKGQTQCKRQTKRSRCSEKASGPIQAFQTKSYFCSQLLQLGTNVNN